MDPANATIWQGIARRRDKAAATITILLAIGFLGFLLHLATALMPDFLARAASWLS